MFGKQKLDKLTLEELEKAVLIKKREVRLERFQRMSTAGHSAVEALVSDEMPLQKAIIPQSKAVPTPVAIEKPQKQKQPKKITDILLLGLEVAALVGLVVVLVASYFNLKELNTELSIAQQNLLTQPKPTASAPISLSTSRLPGGHSSPTSAGGAVPDVPLHLQNWVQNSSSAVDVSSVELEQSPNPPTRIIIPKINVDAPIVGGVSWEDLKKGVGHLPGSANPGERGNLYLAAHNDIFGEIFRYLSELEPGDEYSIYSGEQKFQYVVAEKRIINPTDVEVMLPSTEPISTLQSCYPYLVDTHRIIVIGELVE